MVLVIFLELTMLYRLSLEKAMDWIDNDEWVEVTPENVRIRKKVLEANKRSVIRKGKN